MESSGESVPRFWMRSAQTQPWGSGIGASSFATMQCMFIPEFLCPQVQGLHAPECEQYDYSGASICRTGDFLLLLDTPPPTPAINPLPLQQMSPPYQSSPEEGEEWALISTRYAAPSGKFPQVAGLGLKIWQDSLLEAEKYQPETSSFRNGLWKKEG